MEGEDGRGWWHGDLRWQFPQRRFSALNFKTVENAAPRMT
jgi:hypothetical protein